MPNLEHSKVFRGGVTAPHLTAETRWCTYNVNLSDQALDLRFNLASKGGGTTSVLLQIGRKDLPAILDAIAEAIPDIVPALSSAVLVANAKLIEQLSEARQIHGDHQAQSQALAKKLEGVSEFVDHK